MNAENQQGTIGQPFSWTELSKGGQEACNPHRLLAKTRPPQEGACPPDEDCGEHKEASATVPLFNVLFNSKVVLALFSNRYVCVNILTNARFPVCFSEVEGLWRISHGGKTHHNR